MTDVRPHLLCHRIISYVLSLLSTLERPNPYCVLLSQGFELAALIANLLTLHSPNDKSVQGINCSFYQQAVTDQIRSFNNEMMYAYKSEDIILHVFLWKKPSKLFKIKKKNLIFAAFCRQLYSDVSVLVLYSRPRQKHIQSINQCSQMIHNGKVCFSYNLMLQC